MLFITDIGVVVIDSREISLPAIIFDNVVPTFLTHAVSTVRWG